MPDPEFLLLGDALWLEFVNTMAAPFGMADTLSDSGAYLRWTKAVRVESPADAAAFAEAIRFRAQLMDLARAMDGGRSPPPSAIEAVNTRLVRLEGRQQLVRIGGAWRLRFVPNRPPAAHEAIALSAAQTLASPVERVRRCANPDCGLFFVDESSGQGRRWCSRSRCGQRGRIERRRTARPAPLVAEE
jgi:predicted RNA-binding Zn ribbon-like protein